MMHTNGFHRGEGTKKTSGIRDKYVADDGKRLRLSDVLYPHINPLSLALQRCVTTHTNLR